MTAVFFNEITGNRILEENVKSFKVGKSIWQGRKMNCYVLNLKYWARVYPCKYYTLLEVREDVK